MHVLVGEKTVDLSTARTEGPALQYKLKSLMQASDRAKKTLPLRGSFIPWDIVVRVGVADLSGEPLNVKQLLAAVPYSPMAVRNHLDNLLANEWVYLEGDRLDARRKFIRTRPKLIEALQEVLDQLNVDEEPS